MDSEDQYVEIVNNTANFFQCGNAYVDDGYSHIVAIAM